MRVFDLGRRFHGRDNVAEHRGFAVLEAQTKLKTPREAGVTWRLRLVLAAPDPQRDRVGQRALFGLERVELQLAEGKRTGRNRAERAPAAAWC